MGGLVDRCSVTLGIYGQDVDPDSITEILKCQPTTSHRKGDRTSPRVPSPRRQGAWLLCVEGEAPVEPEELITQLLDRIHPAVPENTRHTRIIQKIKRKVIHQPCAGAMPGLEHGQLGRLCAFRSTRCWF